MGLLFSAKRIANGVRTRTLGESHVNAYYRLKERFFAADIAFAPEPPTNPSYMAFKLCRELGLKPVPWKPGAMVGFYFMDKTHLPIPPDTNLVNARCVDISKRRIEGAFEKVFGYALSVDPTAYQGMAVRKGDTNATHDGKIIECPIEAREDGYVYESLIDNTVGDDLVEDLRTVVVGSQIPVVYRKRRWKRLRFDNTNVEVRVCRQGDVFSPEESSHIVRFAREIGLDFGELDILRDKRSGLIYIVDAANTPFGPPVRLNFFAKRRAVKMIAMTFKQQFIRGSLPS